MLHLKRLVIKRALTPKPFINLLITVFSYLVSLLWKKSFVRGMPPLVMIEPTSYCNLACPLCPSGNNTLQRKRSYLDIELYKKVVDEIKDTAISLLLWNQGEPFLHKDFPQMIAYAKKNKLITMTSTNMNYLPDAEAIVDSGLDILVVSLDGITQDTYDKYRVNGDYQKVLDNTARITEAKKRKNSQFPFVIWQFLIMKHNEHEIPEVKKLAREKGADKLVFKTVQIYNKEDIELFLPTKAKHRRYKITKDGFILKKKIRNRCRRIFSEPVVNCDGELAICCFDKDNYYKIGNLKNRTLKSLWQSNEMNRWRNMILQDRKKMSICLNCGEGINLTVKE